MFQVKRRGSVGYEDLLRELGLIEEALMKDNSGLAMNLMVLEAKIRERFQSMETPPQSVADMPFFNDELSPEEIRDLIPQNMVAIQAADEHRARSANRRAIETVGMAAVLAVITALGVFGLASVLQLTLAWLA